MNDNNENNTYRATRNLNTALESPEYNVNDTLDVNIKDVDNNNYVRENNNTYGVNSPSDVSNTYDNNSFLNNIDEDVSDNNVDSFSNESNSNTFINSDIPKGDNIDEIDSNIDISASLATGDVDNSVYTPTSLEKKKKRSFKIPTELKILIVIVIILLVFVLFMPKIYGLIKKIELFFFNG